MPNTSQVCKDGDALENQVADLENQVGKIRASIRLGNGTVQCTLCGEDIPEARREVMPSAITCIDCQTESEKVSFVGVRRGH